MIGLVPTILASAEQPEGIAALGIDPWAILAQAITFLVLLFVIKKFALDKIIATLEKRRKTIDKGVLLGLEMEKEKAELDAKVDSLLAKARQDADAIIAAGQKEAGQIIREAESAAQRKADAMLDDAHRQISEDIAHAKAELKRDVIDMVGLATSALIREKVDARKDAAIIDKVLEEVRK